MARIEDKMLELVCCFLLTPGTFRLFTLNNVCGSNKCFNKLNRVSNLVNRRRTRSASREGWTPATRLALHKWRSLMRCVPNKFARWYVCFC